MSALVIDTNVYSFLCHGREDLARLLFECDEVIVPAVVVGELEAGFRKGSKYAENKANLVRFLAIARVHVAEVDLAVAEAYGKIHAELKNRGMMIPLNDVWIAATAMAKGVALITFDNHFANIAGLNLILKDV